MKKTAKAFRDFLSWQRALAAMPDAQPVLQNNPRPSTASGVFFLKPSVMDYERLAEAWFKDRNKTFKKSFVRYLNEFSSALVESELLPDGTLTMEAEGAEVYAPNLKRLSRNYAEFNRVLVRENLLHVLALHDKPTGKCREYGIPRIVLNKGIQRRYLSRSEKSELTKGIAVDGRNDQTSPKLNEVELYFRKLLQRVRIDETAFNELEIEVGRFRKLYPMVLRHRKGKHDAKVGPNDGRFYAGYIQAPHEFRSLMRLDGKTAFVEGDVAACHFHFFLGDMTDHAEREQMKQDLLATDPYLAMCGNPVGVSREDLKKSSHVFKYGNRISNYYGLTDYEFAQAESYAERLFYRHFSKRYPKFAEAMASKAISHKKHRHDFACDTMKKESAVMVQAVGARCMAEGLVYLPIHDGFLTLPGQFERVCGIVQECFRQAVGSTPKIRRK